MSRLLLSSVIARVVQLRPVRPWPEVAESVSRAAAAFQTREWLVRIARRLLSEDMVDRKVPAKALRLRRCRKELALPIHGLAVGQSGSVATGNR